MKDDDDEEDNLYDEIYTKVMYNNVSDNFIIKKIKNMGSDFDVNRIYRTIDIKWPLLTIACFVGREELVRYLSTHPKININLIDYYHDTALHIACEYNRINSLDLLLKNSSINVNIQGHGEHTALHYASKGHRNVCKALLLDSRIDVMLMNCDGETAQDRALRMGHYSIEKMINNSMYTALIRIPNKTLLHDIIRMIIEEYL